MVRKRDYLSIITLRMQDRDIYHLTNPLGVRISMLRIGDELRLLDLFVTDPISFPELKRKFSDTRLDDKHLSAFQDFAVTLSFLIKDSLYAAVHTLLQGAVGFNSKAIVYYADLTESSFTCLQAEAVGTLVCGCFFVWKGGCHLPRKALRKTNEKLRR